MKNLSRFKKNILLFIIVYLCVFIGLNQYEKEKNKTLMGDFIAHREYIETIDGKYTGEILNNKFNGTGRFEYFSKEIYTGNWKDSQLYGFGKMVFPNIGSYEGEYENSKRNGNGIFRWLNGDKYDGEWKDDKINGKGTYLFSDGDSFTGIFINNKIYNGKYKTSGKSYSMVISFNDGQISNEIEINYKNGDFIEGTYENKLFSGKARITYSDGSVYEGEIINSKRNGKGTYFWKSGQIYDGDWENDIMQGDGTYYYKGLDKYPKVSGYFSNGKPDGDCDYYETNTITYTTEWSNGKCIKIIEK